MKGEDRIVVQKLKKITVISMIFMAVELAGGYYADSIAIFADAFHLLSDVLAYIISLMAVLMSYRASPPHLTFGYQKLQPLGALLNVAIIWFVTAELFVEATHRMLHQSVVQEPLYMLLTSIFGLLCNLYIMQILHSDEHASGHHNCSHSHHEHLPAVKNKKGGLHEHESHEGCSGHSLEQRIEKPHSQCKGHNHDHHEHHQHNHHQEHKHDHHQRNHEDSHDHEHEQPCNDSPAHTGHSHSHEGPCTHDHPVHKSSQHLCDKQSSRSISSVLRLSDDGGVESDEQMKSSASNFHNNINIEAAYIHIITDIILSIGVIISASIIYFFAPQGHIWSYWQMADPLCTYLFSIMAIYSTIPIIKQSLMLLLDAGDLTIVSQINEDLKNNPQIISVQSLKVWSSNRGKNYGGLKVKVKQGARNTVQKIFSRHKVEGFVQCHEQNEQMMEKQ